MISAMPASPLARSGSPSSSTASVNAVSGSPSASATPVAAEMKRSALLNSRYDTPVATTPSHATTSQPRAARGDEVGARPTARSATPPAAR